jgi:hypothetical protein
MKKEDPKQLPRLAENGKSPVAIKFHRYSTVSFRDVEGKWTRHLAAVPPSIIMKLDRDTRARLWIRNFKVERAWAEANA